MTNSFDVVYTWVNHRDPEWQAILSASLESPLQGHHATSFDLARFLDRGELEFSIKALRRHAPWIRNIFILTNCGLPIWAEALPNVFRIDHSEVFPKAENLPTFNSHAIETVLHRIEGLSERFLYFNDDVFLCRRARPEDFFWGESGVFIFPSTHDIPFSKSLADLRPVDRAAINSACLLERDFGCRPRKKLHHAPFALTKSILREMEQRYPEEIHATRSHRFRHPTDVAMSTTLHAYFAECTGRAKQRAIESRYIDIGDWRFLGLVHPWSPLMRGKFDTLCLNEVSSTKLFPSLRDRIVRGVMRRLFA